MIVRLCERFSEESIAALPEDVRALVLAAEAELEFDGRAISWDRARMDCVVKKNAAWIELEQRLV